MSNEPTFNEAEVKAIIGPLYPAQAEVLIDLHSPRPVELCALCQPGSPCADCTEYLGIKALYLADQWKEGG
jgi:hypothetical protein